MEANKKNNIIASKWRFPVNSIITNGFRRYSKINLGSDPKNLRNLIPIITIPISARIIIKRITTIADFILINEAIPLNQKTAWCMGG